MIYEIKENIINKLQADIADVPIILYYGDNITLAKEQHKLPAIYLAENDTDIEDEKNIAGRLGVKKAFNVPFQFQYLIIVCNRMQQRKNFDLNDNPIKTIDNLVEQVVESIVHFNTSYGYLKLEGISTYFDFEGLTCKAIACKVDHYYPNGNT